jgi:hypothetical protein
MSRRVLEELRGLSFVKGDLGRKNVDPFLDHSGIQSCTHDSLYLSIDASLSRWEGVSSRIMDVAFNAERLRALF